MSARVVLAILAGVTIVACGGEEDAGEEKPRVLHLQAEAAREPCSLITKAEAEATLGALTAAPYRSLQDTTIADPSGPSCVYPTGGGKALVVTPEWTLGKMMIDINRMTSGLIQLVANTSAVNADTLEGEWDDVALGPLGELVFRKGARAITLYYAQSSTDAAGAVRLAGPALRRLAAVPETPQRDPSADGCPLTPEAVTSIVGMPMRLQPRPVKLIDKCLYQPSDDPMVELELAIAPDATAGLIVDGFQQRLKMLLGASARPDTVPMGDGGFAYGSESGSEAAVRARGNMYHARMTYAFSTTTPDLKTEMVKLVAAMMQ